MVVGRPSLAVWASFVVQKDPETTKKTASCPRCNHVIANAKVEKLERHVLKHCPGWSVCERNEYLEGTGQRPSKTARVSIDSIPSSVQSEASANSLGGMTQEEFNVSIANYIFRSGSSFRMVERPSFMEFALKGKPGLTVQSRTVVSGRLLDDAFELEMKNLVELLGDIPYVAVAVDGCKAVDHQKKNNFVLVAPNMKPKLWTTVVTGSEAQSAEYITELILAVVDEVDAAVGRQGFVSGVITDNAKAMQASWEILEEERGLICAGCGAHTLNLLLQDICKLDLVKETMAKVTRVATYFLQRGRLHARFEEGRKAVVRRRKNKAFNRTLTLPMATRWYSVYNCLVSVIKNREAIVGVFEDSEFMEQYKRKLRKKTTPTTGKRKRSAKAVIDNEFQVVSGIVEDTALWSRGKQVMKLLAPIIEKIGLLEKDSSSVGLIYSSFLDLLNHPVYSEPQGLGDTASSIKACIEDRWQFLHTDAMGIAFLLDPAKVPGAFIDNDCDKALGHIREVAERLGYSKGKQEAAFHEANVFLNTKWDWTPEQRRAEGRTAPLEWWGKKRLKYPALFDLARRIFTMPTSSAAAERCWSIHKYIHSKLRNRLLSEAVRKLVFIYSNHAEGNGAANIESNQSPVEDWSDQDSSDFDSDALEDRGAESSMSGDDSIVLFA
jgi:hypothetical protein